MPRASLFASLVLASIATGGLLAAACSTPSSSQRDDSDLINGEVASADAFPSTMQIVGNCTVTRIGERLILTAAHCVRTERGELRSNFTAGSTMSVVVRGEEPGTKTVTIARTLLHPQIEHLCKTKGCQGRASDERRDAPDVAVIEIEEDLPGVPIAEIDVAQPRDGDEVTILGYGCTGTVWGQSDGNLRHLDTRIVPVTASVHSGGLEGADETGLANIDANYAVTPGPTRVTSTTDGGGEADAGDGRDVEAAAGLCPGDSGGALYRKGTNLVVGVNASYTFLPNGDVPVTNWHARVDGQSRWGVAAWLESLGATLNAPCAEAGCRPHGSAADEDGGALPDAGDPDAGG